MDVGIVAQKLSAHSLEESDDVSLLEDESEAGYWSLEFESDEPGDQSRNYRDPFNAACRETDIQLPFTINPASGDDQSRIDSDRPEQFDRHFFVESTNVRNSSVSSIPLGCSQSVDDSNYTGHSESHSLVKSATVMPSLVTVKSNDVESLRRFTARTASVFKVFTRCTNYCTTPDRSSSSSLCQRGLSEVNVNCSYDDQSAINDCRNILDVPKNSSTSLSDDEVSELFGVSPLSQSVTITASSRPACIQRTPSSMNGPWTRVPREVGARTADCQAALNRRWSVFQDSYSCATTHAAAAADVGDRASQAIVIQRPSLDFDKMQRSCLGRKHVQNGINKPRVVKVRCFKTCPSSSTPHSSSSPAQLFDPAIFCFRSLSHHHHHHHPRQQQQQQHGRGPVNSPTSSRDYTSSPVIAAVTCSRCSSFATVPVEKTVKRSG